MQASLLGSTNIHRAAIDIREAIQRTQNKMSWSPCPSDVAESAMNVPKELGSFFQSGIISLLNTAVSSGG